MHKITGRKWLKVVITHDEKMKLINFYFADSAEIKWVGPSMQTYKHGNVFYTAYVSRKHVEFCGNSVEELQLIVDFLDKDKNSVLTSKAD